jgi:hypothetical protein
LSLQAAINNGLAHPTAGALLLPKLSVKLYQSNAAAWYTHAATNTSLGASALSAVMKCHALAAANTNQDPGVKNNPKPRV